MAQVQTFHIDAGTTFNQEITYTAAGSLEGYTAIMQLRENIEDASPVLDLDLAIDVATSKIFIALSADQSSLLTADRYKYQIELYAPDGTVTRLLQGSFKVSAQVVR